MTTSQPQSQLRVQGDTRRRAVIIGGVIPVLIALVSAIAMVFWIPELPDPIAIHWSGDAADGFGPVWLMVLMPLAIVLVFSAFSVGGAWKTTANGLLSGSQKIVLATSVGLSAMLSGGVGWSVAIQRGLEDAAQAGALNPLVLIGAVLAVPAWFLLPKTDATPHTVAEPQPLEVAASERVSWSRVVRLAPGAFALVAVVLALAGGSIVFTATVAPEGNGFAIGALVVVLVIVLSMSYWRVSADRRGLTLRSALGWPRVVIAIDDIREVHLVDVEPRAEFGGWGWRWDGAGRSGIIMRGGPAIQVTRSAGKRFVVTVDDAKTGAAVLAALATGGSAKLGSQRH